MRTAFTFDELAVVVKSSLTTRVNANFAILVVTALCTKLNCEITFSGAQSRGSKSTPEDDSAITRSATSYSHMRDGAKRRRTIKERTITGRSAGRKDGAAIFPFDPGSKTLRRASHIRITSDLIDRIRSIKCSRVREIAERRTHKVGGKSRARVTTTLPPPASFSLLPLVSFSALFLLL